MFFDDSQLHRGAPEQIGQRLELVRGHVEEGRRHRARAMACHHRTNPLTGFQTK